MRFNLECRYNMTVVPESGLPPAEARAELPQGGGIMHWCLDAQTGRVTEVDEAAQLFFGLPRDDLTSPTTGQTNTVCSERGRQLLEGHYPDLSSKNPQVRTLIQLEDGTYMQVTTLATYGVDKNPITDRKSVV